MNLWYIELRDQIQSLMKQEGFTSYTVLLAMSKKEKVLSSNMQITSIEVQEIQIMSLQVYYNQRYYKCSITGFKNIEEEIKKLKEIFLHLEENDYVELENIYHSPVYIYNAKHKLSIQELEEEVCIIQEILSTYNGVIDEMIQLASYDNKEFIFNGAGYEHYNHTEYSDAYISLCYKYNNNTLMESEWDYFLLNKEMDWKKFISTLITILYEYENKVQIIAGSHNVIFNYKVSSALVDMVVRALYGDSIWHNKSFIKKEDLNTHMFCSQINIVENPNLPGSIHNSGVDYSGIDIQHKHLVKDGVIKNLLLNLEYGEKLGMESKGNSWFGAIGYTNIYLEPGKYTYEELLKNMNNGIVVMEILGDGFHVHNGEISISIKGYKLENGKIQGTIHGTISGHIRNILKENVYVANDIVYDQEMNSPSIQVNSMVFAPANREIIEE